MLGSALMGYTYRNVGALPFGSATPPVTVLPVDTVGRFFGAFWLKRGNIQTSFRQEEYGAIRRVDSPTAGARLVIDFRKNNQVLSTTQIWNKRQWRPEQWFGNPATNEWRNYTNAGADARVYNFAPQPPPAPWAFLVPARASYGNAYFPPAGWPGNAPAANPSANAFALAVHPEPFYVCFDRGEGDTLDFRLRAFGDWPNQALGANAINDDAPPVDYGVRPAEQTETFQNFVFTEVSYFLDGWIVRISPTDAEVVTDIPNVPGFIFEESPPLG